MEWVQAEGGEIHDAVVISDRQPYVNKNIEKGTQLLKIPFSCLVSWKTVESTSYGKKLMDAIDAMQPSQFYSPVQDVIIALYLASNQTAKFQPYLDTLPDGYSYDNLPRRWNQAQLKLLTGSPLLSRIDQQVEGVQKDFDLVRGQWTQKGNQEGEFPSFGQYSDRLAAVTSRAFAGFGSPVCSKEEEGPFDDMKIAMVPLLDLCDHHRGQDQTKNLAYQRSSDCGSIIVSSTQEIKQSDTLRITYGAQSNARLLLNYGFCIANNIEPDGSSNDCLDLKIKTTAGKVVGVELRAGPKAHSFHGFVNALDAFHQQLRLPKEEESNQPNETEGFQDFEENEEDFEQFEVDMYAMENDEEGSEEDARKEQEERSLKLWLEALESFEKRLCDIEEGYHLKGDQLKETVRQKSADGHAGLLVVSELRTIHFNKCVIDELRMLLGCGEVATACTPAVEVIMPDEDIQLIASQAKEVAAAFVAIRLPVLNAVVSKTS